MKKVYLCKKFPNLVHKVELALLMWFQGQGHVKYLQLRNEQKQIKFQRYFPELPSIFFTSKTIKFSLLRNIILTRKCVRVV